MLRSRRKTLTLAISTILLAALTGVAAHFWLLDGLDGYLLATIMGDDTTYSPEYSESKFREVKTNMPRARVEQVLGPPLLEVWVYRLKASSLPTVDFKGDRVSHVEFESDPKLQPIRIGMTKDDVLKEVGAPLETSLVYTTTDHDGSYRVRTIVLVRDRVVRKKAQFYVD